MARSNAAQQDGTEHDCLLAKLPPRGLAPQEELCVESAGRQYIDLQERVVGGDSNPQLFCAWDVLYR